MSKFHIAVASRIALAGERPVFHPGISPDPHFTARRNVTIAKTRAWDTAIKHVVADAIRTAADTDLYGLSRMICPAAHLQDGSFDRKMLAAAVMAGEYQSLDGVPGLARLFAHA